MYENKRLHGEHAVTHSLDGDSWTDWVHEVRRMEFDGMMKYVPLDRDATVLELGSGDGFQLDLLRARFGHVFAIDPGRRPLCATGFSFAVGEALPFGDGAFDLVVSNCVLEHLDDRRRGMDEMARVLRPGGYAAHVVPSRFWKVASLLLNPLGYPLRVAEKWWAARQTPKDTSRRVSAAVGRPGVLQVLGRWIYPPIHGTYRSHRSEYLEYGRDQWLESFRHPRFVHLTDAPLVCATQFGFLRFRFTSPLRGWLGRHGFDSSRVFVLQKVR
jgi:SAM-dependent methyltransferase